MYRIQQRKDLFFAELCASCYDLSVKHRKDDEHEQDNSTVFKSDHF